MNQILILAKPTITKVKPNKRLIKFLLIQILAAALRYNLLLNMKPVKMYRIQKYNTRPPPCKIKSNVNTFDITYSFFIISNTLIA